VTVSFGDRLRAWLRGESPAAALHPSRSTKGSSARRRSRGPEPSPELVTELETFVRSRHGVEVYLEPRTRLYGDSVLLVADDGEYLRRSVTDPSFARAFCSRMGLPCYDVARTGYPKRVRDYDKGVRPQRIALEDLPPWPDAGHGDDGGGSPGDLTDDEPPPPPPAD
jgi:hypothetical protein